MEGIHNFTGELGLAESFIRAKCELLDARELTIHLKHTRAKDRDFDGYYRLADHHIMVAVKRRLRYPRRAAYGVGSVTVSRPGRAGRPFRLIWHEEEFRSPDDLAVFGAGHELWHFLCHTGQRNRDHETRANCNGFLWLSEFKRWQGPQEPVSLIPPAPPRPDLELQGSGRARQTGEQLPLF